MYLYQELSLGGVRIALGLPRLPITRPPSRPKSLRMANWLARNPDVYYAGAMRDVTTMGPPGLRAVPNHPHHIGQWR